MYKHTFYYFLGNKKYPEIYILPWHCFLWLFTLTLWRPSREARARIAGSLVWSQITFLAVDFPWVRWISSPSPELILGMKGKNANLENHFWWERPEHAAGAGKGNVELVHPHSPSHIVGAVKLWALFGKDISTYFEPCLGKKYLYILKPVWERYIFIFWAHICDTWSKGSCLFLLMILWLSSFSIKDGLSSFSLLHDLPLFGRWRSHRAWGQNQEWPSCLPGTLEGAPAPWTRPSKMGI